jgi:hypothetical protein
MIKKTGKSDQIKEVFKEERQRGRRPLAVIAERSLAQKRKIVDDAMAQPTEELFVAAMRSYGLSDAELKLALEAWRDGPS